MLEGGNPNARHHGKGLERATCCHGVELSYPLVTVRLSHRNSRHLDTETYGTVAMAIL